MLLLSLYFNFPVLLYEFSVLSSLRLFLLTSFLIFNNFSLSPTFFETIYISLFRSLFPLWPCTLFLPFSLSSSERSFTLFGRVRVEYNFPLNFPPRRHYFPCIRRVRTKLSSIQGNCENNIFDNSKTCFWFTNPQLYVCKSVSLIIIIATNIKTQFLFSSLSMNKKEKTRKNQTTFYFSSEPNPPCRFLRQCGLSFCLNETK